MNHQAMTFCTHKSKSIHIHTEDGHKRALPVWFIRTMYSYVFILMQFQSSRLTYQIPLTLKITVKITHVICLQNSLFPTNFIPNI